MQADVMTPISPAFAERHIAARRAVVLAGMLALTGTSLAAEGASEGAGGEVRNAAIEPSPAREGTAMTGRSRVHGGATSALDRRIALLARELDLDPTQQLKVRSLLEGQREQIVRIWQDESVPGALRVARTQAISVRTEDGIRAVLTDAQRQKYFKPRVDRAPADSAGHDLATYVDQMNRR
jgi:hypothetical protein